MAFGKAADYRHNGRSLSRDPAKGSARLPKLPQLPETAVIVQVVFRPIIRNRFWQKLCGVMYKCECRWWLFGCLPPIPVQPYTVKRSTDSPDDVDVFLASTLAEPVC
jgi:hypothetical protein